MPSAPCKALIALQDHKHAGELQLALSNALKARMEKCAKVSWVPC